MGDSTINIAVVEDERSFRELLCGYLERLQQELGIRCCVTRFSDGLQFVNNYYPKYDLVFLDIEMPKMNGIKAAHSIREVDEKVGIVFVTKMAQYALRGYEVDAIDYILKPVEYFTFAYKFKKALRYCESHRERDVVLTQEDSVVRVSCAEIFYMEKDKNYIVYHTKRGVFRERGTMTDKENSLGADGFALCNSGILVNLRHVEKLEQDMVWVVGKALPVSRNRRKAFVEKLMNYMRR